MADLIIYPVYFVIGRILTAEYIVMYYNCKRAHSTLGYLSPLEYEKKHAVYLN